MGLLGPVGFFVFFFSVVLAYALHLLLNTLYDYSERAVRSPDSPYNDS